MDLYKLMGGKLILLKKYFFIGIIIKIHNNMTICSISIIIVLYTYYLTRRIDKLTFDSTFLVPFKNE